MRRRARAIAACCAAVVLLGAACKSSSDDAAPTTTPKSTSTTASTTSTTLPRFQTCDEIPPETVAGILGAPISKAESLTRFVTGCQYLVESDGAELPVVRIEFYPVPDYQRLKDAQDDETDIPELEDGFSPGTNLVVAKADSGTVQVTALAPLPGGAMATREQLVLVALLAEKL